MTQLPAGFAITGLVVLAMGAAIRHFRYGPKRRARIVLAIGFAALAIGAVLQYHHYRHDQAPADWIAAEVRDVDDPMVRQDVRTDLAGRAARGETVSRTIVEKEIERQRGIAHQQRPAQAQKGALK